VVSPEPAKDRFLTPINACSILSATGKFKPRSKGRVSAAINDPASRTTTKNGGRHEPTYLNVSSASQLSADIKAIDLASQADGGDGTHYVITLKAGATLTESADISAINLAGKDTLYHQRPGRVPRRCGRL